MAITRTEPTYNASIAVALAFEFDATAQLRANLSEAGVIQEHPWIEERLHTLRLVVKHAARLRARG